MWLGLVGVWNLAFGLLKYRSPTATAPPSPPGDSTSMARENAHGTRIRSRRVHNCSPRPHTPKDITEPKTNLFTDKAFYPNIIFYLQLCVVVKLTRHAAPCSTRDKVKLKKKEIV
jgi:hypothetical protein